MTRSVQSLVEALGEPHQSALQATANDHPQLAGQPITGLNALHLAQPGELSFVAQPKALTQLSATQASVLLLRPEWVSACPANIQPWPVPHPALMMAYLSALFAPPVREETGPEPVVGHGAAIDPAASLGRHVTVGEDVVIFPGVVIGDHVTIGDRTVLYPNVTVYRDCAIGRDCIIHAGTVIGSDGFGYVQNEQGQRVKLHQLGRVALEDHVEIGANTTIDRATFGETRIRAGVKIDNLVHIGHNADVGADTVICGQVGFAGTTTIGRGVTVGAQSGMAGHLQVADGATFAARSGVTKSITKPGGVYAGFPVRPHARWLKEQVLLKRMIAKFSRD